MAKKRRRVAQAEECAEEETLTSSSSPECNGSHQTWWSGSSSIELLRATSRDHMMQRRLVRAGMVEVRNTDWDDKVLTPQLSTSK